jgi:hypothetical protein
MLNGSRRLILNVPELTLLNNMNLCCLEDAIVVGANQAEYQSLQSVHSLGYPAAPPHPPIDQTRSYNCATNHQG